MRNNRPSVLIIEDNANLALTLKAFLESLGFDSQITYSGKEGLNVALTNKHQLFLVDLGLGDMNGLEVIETIRTESEKPIIVITGQVEQEIEIDCFKSRINIFHKKPIRYGILGSQIQSLISPQKKGDIIKTKNICMDLERRVFKLDGKTINLTKREFNFILMLLSSNGEVFTRKKILYNIMNYFNSSTENCVDTMVSRIRKKLKEKNTKNSIVQTVNATGYRLNPQYQKEVERFFS